ncbi:MAG: hypothetical protein AB8E82_07015 [Aureispira sp.]
MTNYYKLWGCCLFLLGLALNSFAQKHQAFYDAEKIKNKANQGRIMVDAEVMAILSKYLAPGLSVEEVKAAYSQNPFIGNYLAFESFNPAAVTMKAIQRGYSEGDGGLNTNGMSLDPALFVAGLADFLVQRTKEELHIAFFKDFNKKIKESEELQILFPQTTETILTIESEIYRFNAFWEALRESFIQDLEVLPESLSNYFQQSSKIKDPLVRVLGADCFEIISMLKLKRPPMDIIEYLGERALIHTLEIEGNDQLADFQATLKLIHLFSESMEYIDKSKYWVNPEQFGDMLRDTLQTDFFLGLVYQKGKDLKVGPSTLGTYMTTMRGDKLAIQLFLRTLRKFIEEGHLLFGQVQETNRKQKNASRGNGQPMTKTEKNHNFYSFAEKTINLIDYALKIQRHFVPDSLLQQQSMYDDYIGSARSINKMIYDIQEQKYAVAIIEAIQVIEKLTPDSVLQCEQKLLMKYGSFIAMAVRATTPKEVSQAIEAFALPPGSAAIKKFSDFSIAINAYVGLSGGYEYLDGMEQTPYYAIATPIGISASWGFRDAGSLSIFASILDIGALTAFRFDPNNANTTNPLPDLKFENVFAPGAYLIYGVPKYPLSIGIGGQIGPNLRTVTGVNGAVMQTSGFRLGAFITVDIPITNIYSTNRKYKLCP